MNDQEFSEFSLEALHSPQMGSSGFYQKPDEKRKVIWLIVYLNLNHKAQKSNSSWELVLDTSNKETFDLLVNLEQNLKSSAPTEKNRKIQDLKHLLNSWVYFN